MKNIFIALIQLYRRYLSVLKQPTCKYYPTCSEYALEAIRQKGAMRGAAKAAWRILKCNPLSKGGYDPL